MRFDPPMNPTVTSTDASGFPQLARSPLAFARSAPAFTRALAAAQQQPGGELAVPANLSATLAGTASPAAAAAPWSVSVQSGQTLTGIVRDQMAARGVTISNSEAMRLAQNVARSNNINNANLIHPGQRLSLDSLSPLVNQAQAAYNASSTSAVNNSPANTAANTALAGTAQVQLLLRADRTHNPVLEKTIDRAVDKGFIPAQDKQAVMNKIVQLSEQHRFAPDDFARLTLMESDGMNPKASNSRCHGIIQFCDGPDRGAASAGFGANPKAILGHSVLKQLDMVDKYFEDTGLKNFGPVGLDDLYLTVLTPAARNETRPNVALNIPGQQAAYLHVNRDTRAPITRNSILAGLHQNANERLGTDVAQRNAVQTARMSAYAAQAAVTEVH
ncbi:LysM peptidoglycan-binding domain-containing protein [Limnohabitans sp.]|uniref:LysM peptidoglycan-binding domain-containing protein n=1 Tax=Limnohabitans sp. TaxID=1907725 RepID=UPI0038BDF872